MAKLHWNPFHKTFAVTVYLKSVSAQKAVTGLMKKHDLKKQRVYGKIVYRWAETMGKLGHFTT